MIQILEASAWGRVPAYASNLLIVMDRLLMCCRQHDAHVTVLQFMP